MAFYETEFIDQKGEYRYFVIEASGEKQAIERTKQSPQCKVFTDVEEVPQAYASIVESFGHPRLVCVA